MGEAAARQQGFKPPPSREIILAEDWQRLKNGWAESLRRDHALNMTERMVGIVLAFDFANARTLRCDPKYRDIAELLGVSDDTVKRAIGALVKAGWITRTHGCGRGNRSGYAFLTRARIVPIKGGKYAPAKGGNAAPFSGSQKGANMPGKGGKSAPPYNNDKPTKNQNARGSAPQIAENPLVIRDAEQAVQRFREGRSDALRDLSETKPWVISHILAANLLTPEEREQVGPLLRKGSS